MYKGIDPRFDSQKFGTLDQRIRNEFFCVCVCDTASIVLFFELHLQVTMSQNIFYKFLYMHYQYASQMQTLSISFEQVLNKWNILVANIQKQ